MQSQFSPRLLVATLLFSTFTLLAHAGPGLEYWTTLRTQSDFLQIKPGDKVAYVCTGCDSIMELDMSNPEAVLNLSKEGSAHTCEKCRLVTKVILKRARNDPPAQSVVTYVDEHGEECAFVAIKKKSS